MSEKLMDDLFDGEVDEVSTDKLEVLSSLANRLAKLTLEVEQDKDALDKKKEELKRVSRESIPTILNELNVSEIRLRTGEKVVVTDKVKASVSTKGSFVAHANMVKAEVTLEAKEYVDSLFNSTISIPFDEVEDDLMDLLIDNEVPYSTVRTIHSQTLKKYCREKLASGEPIPDGISVFQFQETVIKK